MKIFLTVGSMLPFDRLVIAMDRWVASQAGEHQIFGQIGDTEFKPVNFEYQKMITPSEYRAKCKASDLIVSHVGMGTVISALEYRLPLIAIPRKPEFSEVTSSHQIATAKWLRGRSGILIIEHENELDGAIKNVGMQDAFSSLESDSQQNLHKALRQYICTCLD